MEKEYTNANKTDNFCNTNGAFQSESKTYSLGSDYSQYCPHRLPCGICDKTNKFCPLGGSNIGDIPIIPTCDPTQTPINPITNPQVWYNVNGINEAHSTDNLDIKGQ